MSVIERVKREIKRRLQVKTPVYVPVLYGELLKGKAALVTGGTRGIGYAIAEAFVRNGAVVVITGRDQLGVDRTCKKLRESASEAKVYGAVMDLTDVNSMGDCFQAILKQIQGQDIDVLVNNAGIINQTVFAQAEPEDFDRVLETDLKGPYFLSKVVSNYMIEHGIEGNILNVTSSSALRPTTTSYGLAKWGMRGFTLGLAKELSEHGIVVNGIAPGPTYTSMMAKDADVDLNRPSSPAGRMTDAQEIGNIASILVSDMGRMIHGDTIYITGGCGNLTLDDWR